MVFESIYGKSQITAEDDAFRTGKAVIDLRDSSVEDIRYITIVVKSRDEK